MIAFVGRERECAELEGGWERARTGQTQHVLLAGEAGIGKTRLLDEHCERVRAGGGYVLRGRCWDVGGAPAYWPWTQAFAALVDEVGTAPLAPLLTDADPGLARLLPRLRETLPAPSRYDEGGGEASQLRLFDGAAQLLRRIGATRPVLVVLDDLEAADAPSLQLLLYLVRARAPAALMTVGAYRAPLPADAVSAPWLPRIGREPAVSLRAIGGLAPDEIGALVEAMTGAAAPPSVARALHQRTGGNPLFASEFVRLIAPGGGDPLDELAAAPVPAGARGLIGQRLATLPARCRELLDLGAVLGREVELSVLAKLAGDSTDRLLAALGPALETGVLTPVPGRPMRLSFSHPLVRESLYEGLAPPLRADLHRRVAETLRAHFAGSLDEHLDAIASHYVAALPVGAAPLAVEYCRLAARRAAGLAARDEAVRMLELALEAAPLIDDPHLTCDVLLELGDAQGRAGRAEEARATFVKVAERADSMGLPAYLARAALGFAGRYLWSRAARRSPEVELCERALAALPPEERGLRARLLARLVGMQRDRRLLPQHRQRAAEAVELGRAAGDYEALSQALNAQAFCDLDDPGRALASIAALEAAAREAGDVEREMQAHDYRLIALLRRGDGVAAEAELAASARLAERLAQPGQIWYAHAARAQMAILRGNLQRAEMLASEARRVGQHAQARESRAVAVGQRHAILREQRRLAELADEAEEAAEQLPSFFILRCVRAHLAVEIGRVDQGRNYLEAQLANGFEDAQDVLHHDYALALCAEMAERLGHRRAAEALAPMVSELACAAVVAPSCVSLGSADRYRGLVAAALGDWQQAARLLREAASANRATGAPLCALRCDLDRARIVLGAPDAPTEARGEAAALLREVAREAESAGFADILFEAQRPRGDAPVDGADTAAPSGASPALEPRELRRIGEFWSLRWGQRTIQLADAKGVRYVAQLLARPGQELSAMALLTGGVSPGEAEADVPAATRPLRYAPDLGPAIDATARAAYRRRVEDLAGEAARAEAAGDHRRSDRAREEQQALMRQLSAATGLGGRARPTGDVSERARQSVTKAIKSVLKRIRREHEDLGRHLEATVHTGLFCRYEPDALAAVPWRVEV
jgi:hypothetical protein